MNEVVGLWKTNNVVKYAGCGKVNENRKMSNF